MSTANKIDKTQMNRMNYKKKKKNYNMMKYDA